MLSKRYQDRIIICTDAWTAVREASSIRGVEIIPISISRQVLTEDCRAGIWPSQHCSGSRVIWLPHRLLFTVTHCKSLPQKQIWKLQSQLILSFSPREKPQSLLCPQPDHGERKTKPNKLLLQVAEKVHWGGGRLRNAIPCLLTCRKINIPGTSLYLHPWNYQGAGRERVLRSVDPSWG